MDFFVPINIKTSVGGVGTFKCDFPVESAKTKGKIRRLTVLMGVGNQL